MTESAARARHAPTREGSGVYRSMPFHAVPCRDIPAAPTLQALGRGRGSGRNAFRAARDRRYMPLHAVTCRYKNQVPSAPRVTAARAARVASSPRGVRWRVVALRRRARVERVRAAAGSDLHSRSSSPPGEPLRMGCDMERNGMERNGMESNGMERNGMERSGVEWNVPPFALEPPGNIREDLASATIRFILWRSSSLARCFRSAERSCG